MWWAHYIPLYPLVYLPDHPSPPRHAAPSFLQKPITFFRQVLSLCEYRELLDNELAAQIYPPDAIEVCVVWGAGGGGDGEVKLGGL
jgi:hypothetical protein